MRLGARDPPALAGQPVRLAHDKHGEPELEELLQFEEPGFVEHTDRMAELDIRDAELADRGW